MAWRGWGRMEWSRDRWGGVRRRYDGAAVAVRWRGGVSGGDGGGSGGVGRRGGVDVA